jgi:hypothetical protein
MKQHPLCTDTEHCHNVLDLPVPADLKQEWAALQTRRHFLGRTGKVLGWAAMTSLLCDLAMRGDASATSANGQSGILSGQDLKLPHFAPKAKRAIYLFMSGGPPQMDILDYKPNLAALYDKDMPESVRGSQQLTGMTAGQARFPFALGIQALWEDGNVGERSAAVYGAYGRRPDHRQVYEHRRDQS